MGVFLRITAMKEQQGFSICSVCFYGAGWWMIRQMHFKRKKCQQCITFWINEFILTCLYKWNGRCNTYWLKTFAMPNI